MVTQTTATTKKPYSTSGLLRGIEATGAALFVVGMADVALGGMLRVSDALSDVLSDATSLQFSLQGAINTTREFIGNIDYGYIAMFFGTLALTSSVLYDAKKETTPKLSLRQSLNLGARSLISGAAIFGGEVLTAVGVVRSIASDSFHFLALISGGAVLALSVGAVDSWANSHRRAIEEDRRKAKEEFENVLTFENWSRLMDRSMPGRPKTEFAYRNWKNRMLETECTPEKYRQLTRDIKVPGESKVWLPPAEPAPTDQPNRGQKELPPNVIAACAILGVRPDATLTELERAKRERSGVAHPDRNKNSQASKRMEQEINAAFDILRARHGWIKQ
jgi:hypothetical protein